MMSLHHNMSSPFQSSFSNQRPSPPPRTGHAGKKRKAENDEGRNERSGSYDDSLDMDMSASPSPSPSLANRALPGANRSIKRARTNVVGRPLPIQRVLESLDAATLRSIVKQFCDTHPEAAPVVVSMTPRPTVQNSLNILVNYEHQLQSSFPYGGNAAGDYAFYRVKAHLLELLNALSDYTQHFLPPNESLATNSLEFLDGATSIIHRLPDWDNVIHNAHKITAYEEISKAWILVIKEGAKRGAGVSLQYGEWDRKLAKHNELSQGRMNMAVLEMKNALQPGPHDAGRSFHSQQRISNSLGFSIQPVGVAVPVQTW